MKNYRDFIDVVVQDLWDSCGTVSSYVNVSYYLLLVVNSVLTTVSVTDDYRPVLIGATHF